MKKIICIVFLLLAAAINSHAQKVVFYDIKTELDVPRKVLRADVAVEMNFAAAKPEKIQFLLYKNANVKSVTANSKSLAYNFDKNGASPNRYLKSARALTIETKNINTSATKIKIQYDCGFDEITSNANSITENWTELGAYSAWFPISFEYGEFTSRVRLKINKDFQVSGTGEVTKKGAYWELLQTKPDTDIVILASDRLKTKDYEFNGSKVRLDFIELSDAQAAQILATAKEFFGYYAELFGEIERSNLTFAINPTKNKASYVRAGFVSIQTQGLAEKQLSQMIGHELAHFWWRHGDTDTWEDWLNESFAEYSALLAMRAKYGDDAKIAVDKYRAEAKDAPPIWGMNRSDDRAFYALYRKGPVILSELSDTIGEENFISLLRETARRKTASTANFLDTLGAVFSKDSSNWLEHRLKDK